MMTAAAFASAAWMISSGIIACSAAVLAIGLVIFLYVRLAQIATGKR
jgi:hypothetical protein